MRVDEQRQSDAPGHGQTRRGAEIGGARGREHGDAAGVDQHVDVNEAVAIRRAEARREMCGKHASALQHKAGRSCEVKAWAHDSRVLALSCQLRSRKCEIALSMTKMKIPATEIITSAANIRGMFSL